jgi:hypothetical protein
MNQWSQMRIAAVIAAIFFVMNPGPGASRSRIVANVQPTPSRTSG